MNQSHSDTVTGVLADRLPDLAYNRAIPVNAPIVIGDGWIRLYPDREYPRMRAPMPRPPKVVRCVDLMLTIGDPLHELQCPFFLVVVPSKFSLSKRQHILMSGCVSCERLTEASWDIESFFDELVRKMKSEMKRVKT